MATLTNTKIKDTYDGLLKTTDNDVIGASEKVITDGLGNASVLSIGTASASFSSDIDINSVTIGRGSGDLGSNAVLGFNALDSNTTGASNTAIGSTALNANTTGSQNTALGNSALYTNTTGGSNTALGYHALRNNTTGGFSTALGKDALNVNTTGSYNVAVGHNSLDSNTTGQNNTAIGSSALQSNVDGIWNTALGYGAGYNKTGGDSNVYIGYQAIGGAVDSNNEIVIGKGATGNGSNTATYGNTSITNHYFTSGTLSTTEDATINGLTIGKGNGSLSTNVAVGVNTLDSVTSGVDNTAIGHSTMQNLTLGVDNAAFGTGAMVSTTTGNNNTSIGSASLPVNTTGSSNTAVGLQAMQVNTTGGANTVVGMNALNDNTEGNRNTTLGFGSGNGIITGSDNIHIGYNTTSGATDVSNEIVIGSGATGNGSNTATYGDSNITGHHFTAGQVNVSGNLAVDTNTLYVDASNDRVGIGTSPASKLHLYTSADSDMALRIQNSPSNFYVGVDNTTGSRFIGSSGSAAYIGTTTSSPIEFATANTVRAIIDSSGNVLIGSSSNGSQSPKTYIATGGVCPLQIDTTAAGGGYLALTTSGVSKGFFGNGSNLGASSVDDVVIRSQSGNLVMQTSGATERMRIESGGNINLKGAATGVQYIYTDGTSTGNTGQINICAGAGSSDYGSGIVLYGRNHASYAGSLYLGASGGAGDIIFGRGQTGLGVELMRIDSSGNVGIGTQSADDLLHLQGSEAVVGATQLTLEGRYEGYSAGINFVSRTSNEGTRVSMAKITADGEDSWSTTASTQDAGLRFFTTLNGSQSERMRIDSSGNVGIGESNPSGNLHISDSGDCWLAITGNSTTYSLLADPNGLRFFTGFAGTERMRITSGGYLKVSNTGTYANATGTYHEISTNSINHPSLYLRNTAGSGAYGLLISYPSYTPNNTADFFIECSDATAGRFIVRSNGGIANYQANDVNLSDERVKKDIAPLTSYWDKFKDIEVVTFKYKDQTHDDTNIGFIAQQVESVAPEFVDADGFDPNAELIEGEEPLKAIYSADMYNAAIKVLQEAMIKIETLEAKVATLESQLNA